MIALLVYLCGLLAGMFGIASLWVARSRSKRYPEENQGPAVLIGLLLIVSGVGLCDVAYP